MPRHFCGSNKRFKILRADQLSRRGRVRRAGAGVRAPIVLFLWWGKVQRYCDFSRPALRPQGGAKNAAATNLLLV